MSIKPTALKELYGKAAGRCAMCTNYESVFLDSVCDIPLTEQNIAEMAHIIAKKEKGPRGDEGYAGDIHSYSNLILLCRNHHRVVDANPIEFSSEWLKNKKQALENWVEQCLISDPRRSKDIASLCAFMNHVPFTKIRGQYEDLPDSFYINFFDAGEILRAFPVDLPGARPFFDNELESKFSKFERSYFELTSILTAGMEVGDGRGISFYNGAILRGTSYVAHFNKGEMYAHKESFEVQQEISRLKNQFTAHYQDLIRYLRFNFIEVDLQSYAPYKW